MHILRIFHHLTDSLYLCFFPVCIKHFLACLNFIFGNICTKLHAFFKQIYELSVNPVNLISYLA